MEKKGYIMSTIGDMLNKLDKENADVYWKRIKKLEAENKKLKTKLELAMSQNYCKMCGNTLDGYVPPKKETEGLE